MGICYKFFCPKKNGNKENKKNDNKQRFKISISISPQIDFNQMNNQLKINKGLINLNSSIINKSSENMNSSNLPFNTKQSVKISNISNQTPKLKYSSSMSKNKLIRTVRTQKYIRQNIPKKK